MSIVTIEDTNLTNIANAIRSKKGTSAKYKPNQMASAIESISGSEDLTNEFNTYETHLTEQETTIEDIVSALQNKASGGGGTTYAPRRISFQDYHFETNDDGTDYDMSDEVKNIDTSNVKSFYNTFYNVYGVSKLDLSNWITPNCQDFSYMFDSSSFEYIDMSNFTFENAFTVVYMFANCWNLKTLVLGEGWLELNDMHLEEDMGGMPGLNPTIPLLDDTSIEEIYVPDELVSDFQGHQIFSLYADYIKPKSEMGV